MKKEKFNTIITKLAFGLTNANKEDKPYIKKVLNYYIDKALKEYRVEGQKN
jgi:hypothetical protein